MAKGSKGFNTPFRDIAKKVKPVADKRAPPRRAAKEEQRPPPEKSDEDLFARAMRGVSRRQDESSRIEPPKRRAAELPDDEALALAELQSFTRGQGPFSLEDSGESASGRAPGVSETVLNDLKRGKYAFHRHLDLHGKSREAAKAELFDFVATARRDAERCVLIVTGRGKRSPQGRAILRDALPRWLSRAPLRAHVLAFCTARLVDGGPGASYVLLRRAGIRPFGEQP